MLFSSLLSSPPLLSKGVGWCFFSMHERSHECCGMWVYAVQQEVNNGYDNNTICSNNKKNKSKPESISKNIISLNSYSRGCCIARCGGCCLCVCVCLCVDAYGYFYLHSICWRHHQVQGDLTFVPQSLKGLIPWPDFFRYFNLLFLFFSPFFTWDVCTHLPQTSWHDNKQNGAETILTKGFLAEQMNDLWEDSRMIVTKDMQLKWIIKKKYFFKKVRQSINLRIF